MSSLALPTLLTLPSATDARKTYKHLIANALTLTRALSTVPIASFALAYLVANKRGRHPYLLWSALLAAGALGIDYVSPAKGGADGSLSVPAQNPAGQSNIDQSFSESNINGEMVESAVKARIALEVKRCAFAGVAFVMSVVGIWGDGA